VSGKNKIFIQTVIKKLGLNSNKVTFYRLGSVFYQNGKKIGIEIDNIVV
jgi:hypothetical protein